jgi:hypothetical protein
VVLDRQRLAGVAAISPRMFAVYRHGRKRGRTRRLCGIVLLRKGEQPLFGKRVGQTGDIANPGRVFLEISVIREQIAFV